MASAENVGSIAAIMIHVGDVAGALAWYRRAFPEAVPARDDASGFDYLALGGIALEFVPADGKVGSGPFGSVVYWNVPDFDAALAHLTSVGARRYRGPMRIGDDRAMCQLRDPWDNCIGIRGSTRADET